MNLTNLTNFVIFSNFKIQIWQVTKSIDSITHITFCCKSIHLIFSCCVVHKKLHHKVSKQFPIAGSVWVYKIHGNVSSKPSDPNFCESTVYYFAFALLTIAWCSLGLSCIVGCCCFKKSS